VGLIVGHLLRTDICPIDSMKILNEEGRRNVVEKVGTTVSACLVESKVPSLLSTGMGQVSLEPVTLGADSTRRVSTSDVSNLGSLISVSYSDAYIQNVIVTDGDNWKFGVVDVAKQKVYFSKDLRLNNDITLVKLLALASVWTVNPVSHVQIAYHSASSIHSWKCDMQPQYEFISFVRLFASLPGETQ
jgi:hypothetical protein